MLSNIAKSTILACGIVGSLLHSLPAAAYDCDLVETYYNKSGLLSFTNYFLESSATGAKLQIPEQPVGGCQPGTLTVRAPNPLRVPVGGDGTVKRDIELFVPYGGSQVVYSKFSTRFDLEMLPQSYNPGQQSLTIRELQFTPYWNDLTETPGMLRFTLSSGDGGATWMVHSRLTYMGTSSQVDYGYYSAQLLPAAGLPGIRVGLQVDYVSEYAPSTSRWTPKVKISYLRSGTVTGTREYTLPTNMTLVSQRQGYLEGYNLKKDTTFSSINKGTCQNDCPLLASP